VRSLITGLVLVFIPDAGLTTNPPLLGTCYRICLDVEQT